MKKILIIAISVLLITAFSLPTKAGVPVDGKPKYASVNIFFRGMAPAKIFTILDGKVESVKSESAFSDQDAGELAIFGPVQTALEKLGEMGYKLVSTTSLAPSLMVYTLVKE